MSQIIPLKASSDLDINKEDFRVILQTMLYAYNVTKKTLKYI